MSSKTNIGSWISKDSSFSYSGQIIFCHPCGSRIKTQKKWYFDQHKLTKKHKDNVEKKKMRKIMAKQSLQPQISSHLTEYSDLPLVLPDHSVATSVQKNSAPLCQQQRSLATFVKIGSTADQQVSSIVADDPESEFTMDLCEALIRADIPLNVVDNENFRAFMKKYSKKDLPSTSTLRQTYFTPKLQERLWKD